MEHCCGNKAHFLLCFPLAFDGDYLWFNYHFYYPHDLSVNDLLNSFKFTGGRCQHSSVPMPTVLYTRHERVAANQRHILFMSLLYWHTLLPDIATFSLSTE